VKKKALMAALLSTLLTAAVAGTSFVGSVTANPFGIPGFLGIVRPRSYTNLPTVSIRAPQNDAVFLQNWVELDLFVNIPTGRDVTDPCIIEIYYTPSWNQTATSILSNREYIDHFPEHTIIISLPLTFSGSLNVTGVPDGNQSITVYAEYQAFYHPYSPPNTDAKFYITGSSTVNFVIDAEPVNVSVISPQKQEYTSPDVPVTFVVDEETSYLSYSLDGGVKVAVQGNTTLAGLSPGTHNVTVYASDRWGKKGASETVVFTVSEQSQPLALMGFAAASAVAAVSILAGILLYSKRRKRKLNPPQAR